MRRSLSSTTIAFALLAVAAFLPGCRVEPEESVDVAPELSGESDSTEIDADAGEESLDAESTADGGRNDIDEAGPDAAEKSDPDGLVGSRPQGQAPSGVEIRLPGDFQRPTHPDATLEEAEEPAEPPVQVTDRSAEAEEPTVLPGDVPIEDLYEGLDGPPTPGS